MKSVERRNIDEESKETRKEKHEEKCSKFCSNCSLPSAFSASCMCASPEKRERPRYYRIRDSRRSLGRVRNPGNLSFPTKNRRALGIDLKRNTKFIVALLKDKSGQSTVEYAVVAAIFITAVVALGSLASILKSGVFVEHALSAASHHIAGGLGGVVDVFCY